MLAHIQTGLVKGLKMAQDNLFLDLQHFKLHSHWNSSQLISLVELSVETTTPSQELSFRLIGK